MELLMMSIMLLLIAITFVIGPPIVIYKMIKGINTKNRIRRMEHQMRIRAFRS